MNFLKRTLWAAVATVAVAGGVSAQGIGGLGGTTTGTGGGTAGLGNLSSLLSGATGGGTGGGGGFGGGGTGGTGGSTTTAGSSGAGAINLTPPSSYAQAPQSVATSNNIGKFYANPLYQGRAGVNTTSYTSVVNPGGFGAPLYGTNFGASQGTTGGGGRGGAGGTTGGFGGAATGAGGGGFGTTTGGNARGGGAMGGLNTGTTNQSGQVVNPGVAGISYTATIKFDTRTVTPAEFQANMQGVINRTSAVSNPGGVQVITGPNGAVTLRGTARNEDEARAAENVLRLTPGVRDVTNELTFPRQ